MIVDNDGERREMDLEDERTDVLISLLQKRRMRLELEGLGRSAYTRTSCGNNNPSTYSNQVILLISPRVLDTIEDIKKQELTRDGEWSLS